MSKVSKITLTSLIAIVAAVLIIIPIVSCSDEATTYEKYYDLQFHRGGRAAMPENTLYAYNYAIETGATTIEGDMQMTKDGVVVMSHNPVLDPNITQDKNGKYITQELDIRTMNYSEVEQYNVGHIKKDTDYYKKFGTTQYEVDAKIPTLEELFKLVRDSGNKEIMLNLETKLYPDSRMGIYYQNNVNKEVFVNKILDLAKQYGMEKRLTIQSFDWGVFPLIKKANPNIRVAALWEETPDGDYESRTLWLDTKEPSPWLAGYNIHDFGENAIDIAYALGCDIISPQLDEITTMQIIQAHDWGMRVVPWTVNTIEDMEKVWEMECDGFITDYGYLARELLLEKEVPLPKTYSFNSPYHINLD